MAANLFPLERIGERSAQRIVCSGCGEWDRNTWGERASDETLVAFFRRRGWQVDAKRGQHLCKACVDKASAKRREQEALKRMEKVVPMSPPPSPDSAFAKKIMSDLLFEHYDLSARDYKPGWTDARIAKESGLSETFVAQRRASDYGPVTPQKPPILQAASAAVGHVVTSMRDIASTAEALKAKSDALTKQAERLLADLAEAQKSKGAA